MKCEHGNEISVNLEPESPPFWDDGIKTYNEDGTRKSVFGEKEFVTVNGCDKCKTVEIVEC